MFVDSLYMSLIKSSMLIVIAIYINVVYKTAKKYSHIDFLVWHVQINYCEKFQVINFLSSFIMRALVLYKVHLRYMLFQKNLFDLIKYSIAKKS